MMKAKNLLISLLRNSTVLALLLGGTMVFATSIRAQNLPQQPQEPQQPTTEQPTPQEENPEVEDPNEIEDFSEGSISLSAVVTNTGTLVRGVAARSATKAGIGTYRVIFRRRVNNCAYVATIGLSNSNFIPPPGEISVAGLFNNARGVYVRTYNSAGAAADRDFHLVVVCPQ